VPLPAVVDALIPGSHPGGATNATLCVVPVSGGLWLRVTDFRPISLMLARSLPRRLALKISITAETKQINDGAWPLVLRSSLRRLDRFMTSESRSFLTTLTPAASEPPPTNPIIFFKRIDKFLGVGLQIPYRVTW
jgi:hypothetical protein